jgi:hypothetical protein
VLFPRTIASTTPGVVVAFAIPATASLPPDQRVALGDWPTSDDAAGREAAKWLGAPVPASDAPQPRTP